MSQMIRPVFRGFLAGLTILAASFLFMVQGTSEAQAARCRAPLVFRNGICQLPATCAPGFIMRNGRCVRRARAVPRQPQVRCIAPRVMRNGRCVLQVRRLCPPPKVWRNGHCRNPAVRLCPPPKVWRNGRCRNPVVRVCPPPKVWRNGRCRLPVQIICIPPRVRIAGRCLLPRPVCPPPLVRSPLSGRCIVPVIVDPIPQADCRAPFIYSERAGGCIRIRPRPEPRDNIAWIQSCLNTLGFNAGAEDGIAGRRTRSGWDEFRRANGLPPGFVPYTDPQTLAALYEQCRPSQGSEPPQAVLPRRENPPRQPAADEDDFIYPQAMCATGPLYRTLTRQFGENINLEKCGTSCVPIPEGMSPAEARRQQTRNGINWCTECIRLGDEGLLCPLPPGAPPANGQ